MNISFILVTEKYPQFIKVISLMSVCSCRAHQPAAMHMISPKTWNKLYTLQVMTKINNRERDIQFWVLHLSCGFQVKEAGWKSTRFCQWSPIISAIYCKHLLQAALTALTVSNWWIVTNKKQQSAVSWLQPVHKMSQIWYMLLYSSSLLIPE